MRTAIDRSPSTSGRPSVPFRRLSARALIVISTVDLLFLLLVVGVPLTRAQVMLSGDGDLGRHLRVGYDIIQGRSLFFADPYSWTMAGQPFVPYEWASEVLVALANMAGGLPAVIVLSGLIIALTNALVVVFLRRVGVDPLLAVITGVVALMIGSIHWRARPHLWTPLGALLTLWLLERGSGRRVWLFVPIFVAWVNLHGGFIYGLILIAVYLFGDLVEAARSADRPLWLSRARYHAGALALSVVASCVNPSGPRIFAHVTGYIGNRFLVDRTQEYQSPDFHTLAPQLFLAVLALIMLALALNPQRPTFPRLLLLVVNLAFALYSARNLPLFVVTALPVAVIGADALWRRAALARRFGTAIGIVEGQSLPGLWALAGAAAMIALALNHGYAGGIAWLPAQFQANDFPVAAVERARAEGLQGRLFNDFAWGGYVLYAWPEQRVFIDGQTDFYGEELSRRYLQIEDLQSGWREALRDQDVAIVLVRTTSPLARELAREPGWRVWYADGTATLLRHGGGASQE